MRRATAFLLSASTVVPLLVACGTGGSDDLGSAPAASETTSSRASASAGPTTDAPAFPDDTADQFAKLSGEWDLVFTDVRRRRARGLRPDRAGVTGTGVPGWSVGYVDEECWRGAAGSSRSVATRSWTSTPRGPPGRGPGYYSGPRRVRARARRERRRGLRGRHGRGLHPGARRGQGERVPFRVFALADPARLVVDIWTAAPTEPVAGASEPSRGEQVGLVDRIVRAVRSTKRAWPARSEMRAAHGQSWSPSRSPTRPMITSRSCQALRGPAGVYSL